MVSIQSKLPDIGTTIFTVMSQLAQQHNAINLGQGFPDFAMPQPLINAVCHAMNNGHNQYAHTNGLPLLRERLAQKIGQLYGASIDAETEITITPGATYALFTALSCLLQPGDEVIVFEPAYDSYVPNILSNGAIPVFVKLSFPHYTIDWEVVKRKIGHRTKAIIINTPHNPTGSILRHTDIEQLAALTEGTDIAIISDEVYEHLVYDGRQHQSILRYPELLARSFVCFSFGKTYHCTGWKVGYCVAGERLTKEFRKLHQYNAFSTNTPVQWALAEVLQNDTWYTSLGNSMQQKRDDFVAHMSGSPLEPLSCSGSFFQCFSYAGYSSESDKKLAMRLVKEAGVASIPLSAFYSDGTDNHVLRFCFAKQDSTLRHAAERLKQLS